MSIGIKDRLTVSIYEGVKTEEHLLEVLNSLVPKRNRANKLKEWAIAYLAEHPEIYNNLGYIPSVDSSSLNSVKIKTKTVDNNIEQKTKVNDSDVGTNHIEDKSNPGDITTKSNDTAETKKDIKEDDKAEENDNNKEKVKCELDKYL